MSIDLKTASLEAKRTTFDHIERKLGEGKKPTRYQEVMFGHQATRDPRDACREFHHRVGIE